MMFESPQWSTHRCGGGLCMKSTPRRERRNVRFAASEEIRRGAGGSSHLPAVCRPFARGRLRGCFAVLFVFSWCSLGVSLVFSAYSAAVTLARPRSHAGGHTEPSRCSDTVGFAATQTKSQSHRHGLIWTLLPGSLSVDIPTRFGGDIYETRSGNIRYNSARRQSG